MCTVITIVDIYKGALGANFIFFALMCDTLIILNALSMYYA